MESLRTAEVKRLSRSALLISFFFHRRGTTLQYSDVGFYRSMLHQVLANDSSLLARFCQETKFEERCKAKGRHGSGWEWTASELKDCLREYVRQFTTTGSLRLHIDALDEAGQDTARYLLRFLGELSTEASTRLSICVSSRPWPNLVLGCDYCITVEMENHADIQTYLHTVLDVSSSWDRVPALEGIRGRIAAKAAGVFQWVVLVARRVTELHAEPLPYIMREIQGLPAELDHLYENLLSSLQKSDMEMAPRIFRWITFAHEPLSLTALREAVASDPDRAVYSRLDLQNSMHWCEDDSQMVKRLSRLSRGLVCIVKPPGATQELIQWDHETVRGFMTSRGLRLLDAHTSEDSLRDGAHHHFLSIIFIRFLATIDVHGDSYRNREQRIDRMPNSPFAKYAVRYGIYHLRSAEEQGCPQHDLIDITAWPRNRVWANLDWFNANDISQRRFRHSRDASLQNLASKHGLYSVMEVLLPMCKRSTGLSLWNKLQTLAGFTKVQSPALDDVDVKDTSGRTPLSWAAELGDARMVKLLLASMKVEVDSTCNSGRTALSYAADGGHDAVVQLLLLTGKVNVNSRAYGGETPLMFAAKKQNVGVVMLPLSTNRININAVSESGQTALSYAADHYHRDVVEALLSSGKVNVDPIFHRYLWPAAASLQACGNLLLLAAFEGDLRVVEVLLAANADVNAVGELGLTVLQQAVLGDCIEVVRLLIRRGANVNLAPMIGHANGSIALHFAVKCGHLDCVKVLVKAGSDLAASDEDGRTPLDCALLNQAKGAVVSYLKSRGATPTLHLDRPRVR